MVWHIINYFEEREERRKRERRKERGKKKGGREGEWKEGRKGGRGKGGREEGRGEGKKGSQASIFSFLPILSLTSSVTSSKSYIHSVSSFLHIK